MLLDADAGVLRSKKDWQATWMKLSWCTTNLGFLRPHSAIDGKEGDEEESTLGIKVCF